MLAASLKEKRPDAAYVAVDADHWSRAAVEEHLGGQGLFSNKYIVFLDRVTENAEGKDELPGLLEAMNESANIFIVLEAKANAELKKSIDAHAEKAVLSDLAEKKSGPEFNVFALGEALASRDSFKAWKLYREAIDGGSEPEAIAGMLFWKAKMMVTKGGGKYSAEESKALLGQIIVLYHDAHRGLVDFELGLERMMLS